LVGLVLLVLQVFCVCPSRQVVLQGVGHRGGHSLLGRALLFQSQQDRVRGGVFNHLQGRGLTLEEGLGALELVLRVSSQLFAGGVDRLFSGQQFVQNCSGFGGHGVSFRWTGTMTNQDCFTDDSKAAQISVRNINRQKDPRVIGLGGQPERQLPLPGGCPRPLLYQ